MWFLNKKYIFVVLCLFITSCGFKAVHVLDNPDDLDIKLASIEISNDYLGDIRNRKINQQFEKELRNQLNPNDIEVDPKYRLNFVLSKSKSSSVTRESGSTGRYNMTLTANYNLEYKNSSELRSKKIRIGKVRSMGSFNVDDERLKNYAVEEEVLNDLIDILVRKLKDELVDILMSTEDIV